MSRVAPRSPNKYGAKRTTLPELPGQTFDSKAEARRARELLLMEKAGEIRDLKFHVRYPLKVNGQLVCTYVADFTYRTPRKTRDVVLMTSPPTYGPEYDSWGWRTSADGGQTWTPTVTVEDVKSAPTRTPVFKLKKKLMRAIYGLDVQEVA